MGFFIFIATIFVLINVLCIKYANSNPQIYSIIREWCNEYHNSKYLACKL